MQFIATPLSGCWVIEIERLEDERGFFARSFCTEEFAQAGLVSEFVQCNISFNAKQGTVRGMHFQAEPNGETKLVRCTTGSIYDVVVDVRHDSDTFGQHFGVELTASNHRMLYIPKGLAHGFQSLEPNCEVFYQMADMYVPGAASGIRYNDPDLGIEWPLPVSNVSPKDLELPRLKDL